MIAQYRICWSVPAGGACGASEWRSIEDDGLPMTFSEIEGYLFRQHSALPAGLEIALDVSGFEWWVEMR